MSEMVERVAKAIWEAECSTIIDDDLQAWQQMVARAALKSMREPTYPMLEMGNCMVKPLGDDVEEIWQAMIDEAMR